MLKPFNFFFYSTFLSPLSPVTHLIHSLFDPASLIHSQTLSVRLGLAEIFNLLAILANFCYYLWVPLHFLILFTGPIVLFSLFFNHFTALLTKSFQFQLNKLFTDEPLASFIHFQPLFLYVLRISLSSHFHLQSHY